VASQSSSTLWKTSNALIRLRLIFVVLGAWLAAMTISPVAHAAAFTYDVSQTAHVDVDVEISATDHLYPVKGSSLYPVKGSSAIRVERASAAEGTYSTRLTADIATNNDALISGILRDATAGKGNFGLGSASEAISNAAGEAWVGPGYRVSSGGKAWVSADGLRQFRPASYKPNLSKTQSNFESRLEPSGQWQSNGHLDIVGGPGAC
jgi:hypothetical protein